MKKRKYDTVKEAHAKFVPPVERMLHYIRNADDPIAAGKLACQWLREMLFTRSSPEADAVIHSLKERRVPDALAKEMVHTLIGGQKGRRRNPTHRHVIYASDLDKFVECERHYIGYANYRAMAILLKLPRDSQKEGRPEVGYSDIETSIGNAVHSCLKADNNKDEMIRLARRSLRKDMPGLSRDLEHKYLGKVMEMMQVLRDEGRVYSWDGKLPVDRGMDGFAIGSSNEIVISNSALLCGRPDWIAVRGNEYRLKEVKTSGSAQSISPIMQLAAYRMLVMAAPGFENVSQIADEIVVARPGPGRPAHARSYEHDITTEHEAEAIKIVNKITNYLESKETWKKGLASLPASQRAGKGCHLCERCKMRNTSACPETQVMKFVPADRSKSWLPHNEHGAPPGKNGR